MYLNCKTFFSLRYGTMHVQTLLNQAIARGITTMALTNINNTSDSWEFIQQCRQRGIKPVLGLECRNEHIFRYILLAKNEDGWFHINRFLSTHLQEEKPFPDRAPYLPHTFVIYAWKALPPGQLEQHELLGILPKEVNQLFRTDTFSIREKLVILQPLTFQDDDHYELHQLLCAIDQNILISQLSPATIAAPDETWVTPVELVQRFEDHPHIIHNTLRVLEACNINPDLRVSRNKKCFLENEAADRAKLRELAMQGMIKRYGPDNKEALKRVENELKVVAQHHFEAYFLITWDIIRFARERGFFYVGRGSGANSILAYCLKITDVDPIELNLYFERFLNPYRSSPPDFDIDFSWRDRDEIIDYVFRTYGKEHTALMGTVTTFQTRAMIRELGKVYGLPKKEIDKILENPFDIQLKADTIQHKIMHFCQLMESQENVAFPNHLSIHAGGILISEQPIHYHCTTYMPPKGFLTAQLDMHQAEAIGLFKFDILSQRGLGHIRDAIDMILENKGVTIDIHDVKTFMADPKVKHQLKTVNTIGCFYIESPAMRQLLKKLRCDDYLSLVAASSIIRPGVAQSGMMREYVQRYRHPEQVTYLHPVIEDLLKETFGIMVYQEDVIKVAHFFADMELADADTLRRAMAGKYRGTGEFEKIQERFLNNCERMGRPPDVSREVWRQIASFANFSFSKAHSASFAVESYQSLFLKTYFPAEFMVAVINNFGGFYNRELYFRELKKTGVQIHPPCINNSTYYTKIKGNDVYTGFIHVDGLEEALVERILGERDNFGTYLHLEDFTARIAPSPEQLEILVRIGCFNFTGYTKKELLWKSSLLVKKPDPQAQHNAPLFAPQPVDCTLPALTYHAHEDAFDEIELLGFSLTSPFNILRHPQHAYLPVREFEKHKNQSIITLGYLVTTKFMRTSKGEPMCFGTFLDQEGEFLDTVHFPESLRRYPFQKGGFYILEGKITEEHDVMQLEISHMRKIGYFETTQSANAAMEIKNF